MRPTAPLTRAEPPSGSGRRKSLWIAAGAYLLFVVYGSLVPLDFYPRPLDSAWRDFLKTSYLTLGVGSRADWVANILLYIPLAYLLCAGVLTGVRSAIARLIAVAAVFVVCAAVALGVEFTQLFFPPRTVSLNDIVAEFIGATLGIGVWLVWGRRLERLWADMTRGGLPAIRAAVVGYVAAYLAFSFFPYDFLVSAQEFAEKFSGNNYRLLVTSATCDRLSLCAARIFAETVAVVPLGVLLGMALGKSARRVYATAAICGFALGVTIETAQLFLASGISEGVSLLTRAAGLPLGVALSRHVHLDNLAVLRPYIVRALLAAIPLYLVVLIWANAWFSAHWLGVGPAHAKLDGVHWLPFYYHYFSTETHALRSLLAVAAMYLPVGFGYWMWTLRATPAAAHGSALIPALIAASLAAMMEMGKLFLPGKHPDPTDVLIAMAAATGAYLVATMVYRWAVQHESALAPPARSDVPQGGSLPSTAASNPVRVLAAILLLAGAGIAIWHYPLGGGWLMLALGLYAVVLWRHPGLCLPAVLALLPLLDLSLWSGWILLSEFDLLMAVTLAVRLSRSAGRSRTCAIVRWCQSRDRFGRGIVLRERGGRALSAVSLRLQCGRYLLHELQQPSAVEGLRVGPGLAAAAHGRGT